MWKLVNSAGGAEILLYGEISESAGLLHETRSSPDFARELASLEGAPVTVRINSGGGDIFAAQAMYSQLRDYVGRVTVVIDGLCASAATVVAMAGDEVIMPANALMMIHNPAAGLNDFYTAGELNKAAQSLEKVKETILAAYMSRAKVSRDELERMMDEETWLDADECVALGFADHVSGSVDAVLDRSRLVINSATYSITGFKNIKALKERVKGGNSVTKLEAILNRLGLFDEVEETPTAPESAAETVTEASAPDGVEAEPVEEAPEACVIDTAKAVAEALTAERARVAELESMMCDSAAVNAIIATAKANGRTAADIAPYIEAITAAEAVPETAKSVARAIAADIADSGAANVVPSPAFQTGSGDTGKQASIDYMVKIMNEKAKK